MVDLDTWIRGEREIVGNRPKRWFFPEIGAPKWLFKPRTEKTVPLSKERLAAGDSPDRIVGGEDWAEKIVAEVSTELGVPVVHTELATVTSLEYGTLEQGSMSRDMRPRDWETAPGAQLLAEHDDEFDSDTSAGHTLEAVQVVLNGAAGPPGSQYESWESFDVFAGYLLLDAWVANTDRHSHNWGVLKASGGPDKASHLAPSYDHGRAFGSGMSVAERQARVVDGSVDKWCARGVTRRFDGGGKQDLVELASRALKMATGTARDHWLQSMHAVDLDVCHSVIEATPGLSEPVRSFVGSVLTTNRRRLIDALD